MVSNEWASGGAGAARQTRSESYCGEIVTRAGRGASVFRPRQMGKLIFVLARLWSARVHPITDSNIPEAGDGPLPVPGGMG
jgi:hypothetical protein